jgi:hypothetical protein
LNYSLSLDHAVQKRPRFKKDPGNLFIDQRATPMQPCFGKVSRR